MDETARRIRFAAALVLALSVVGVAEWLPADAAPPDDRRIEIEHFLTGLACVESGGRYGAVNRQSGAYGKYQIMPRNWPRWAKRYLGYRDAEPTAYHQEIVAKARVQRLHRQHRGWRLVAYWWLTGDTERDETRWSGKARGYVNAVMAYARRAATPDGARRVPGRCWPRAFEAPVRLPDDRVRVRGGAVNVRRKPGYENRLVGVVRKGDVLAVLDRKKDRRGKPWIEVVLPNGRTGWVARWYTRPAD